MPNLPLDDLQTINNQLKTHLLQKMPSTGDYATAINNLGIYRRDDNHISKNCFYNPMVSIIVQGCKRSVIGSKEYLYGSGHYLITSVDVPAINTIMHSSAKSPFLSLALLLDDKIINQLISEYPHLASIKPEPFNGISVKKIEHSEIDILNAFLRLVQLLDKADQIPVLAPMIIKEIHYLLLIGPFGNQLRSIHTYGSQSNYIANTINWLKKHYRESMIVEDLAQRANMSLSSFHRHFKAITTLTPLQYQKQLRLHEARRLMLIENSTASNAGFTVGYESATQFNREYKRLFGQPPYKDAIQLR